jgi:hypothetical protein
MKGFKVFQSVLVASVLALVGSMSPAFADDARVLVFSETYDAADTADGAGITNVIAAPGAVLGDACIASIGVDALDVTLSCIIQAANVAEVRMQNESGSSVNLAETTWRVFVFKKGTR